MHPSWAQRARDEFLAKLESYLTWYRALQLNTFERVQLLNSVLIPRWLYHTMFIPHDRMFQHIGAFGCERLFHNHVRSVV